MTAQAPFAAVLAAALALLLLQGCASAPKPPTRGIADERPMQTLRDEPFAQSERFLDADAVLAANRIGLPAVRVADGAAAEGISAAQAALVANRAARATCAGLARHFVIDPQVPELAIELVVTSIRPTSAAAAGASALLGVFVPGPFRLPAGLGGLAADAAVRRDGEPVMVLHWAEGADAITEDAKISPIGDAYQLADGFADDVVAALVDPRGDDAPDRPRLDAATREANSALCLARFGRASVAGRGVSILLPLAPEAIDAGAPDDSGLPAAAEPEDRVDRAEADNGGQ
ncbi:MAG TPA: hypothetical protein DCM32_01480 [Xanthomonadaceae bacterium]|jgi:hypothetical protein|nr:hypothetical protein [Xanthomonadaceae bacterium]